MLRPWRLARRVALGLVAVYLLGTFVQVWLASRRDSHPASGAIVVLGAAQYDGRPSPALRARLDHAVELFEGGVAPVVVVTGGRQPGDRFTEATAAANYLIAHGVPDERIEREVQGRDSWQSLRAVKRFLARQDIEEVVLVSDGYHSARIAAIAREVGLKAHTSPVSTSAPLGRLIRETGAVAVGRIIGFRRLSALLG
jgi:uncharacterized SAM-binding protein YcdF (DUF218 family)